MVDETDDIFNLPTLEAPFLSAFIRQRWENDNPYTMCKSVCIAVNPMKELILYTKQVQELYSPYTQASKAANVAHIYLLCKNALQNYKQKNQTLVITGESGAGKTESARICLDYLATISGKKGTGGAEVVHRQNIDDLISTSRLFEAIGNAQTIRNANSSRFGKCLRIFLSEENSAVCGASMNTYLLEKSRAVNSSLQEGTFHIFYSILNDQSLIEEHGLHSIPSHLFGKESTPFDMDWSSFCEMCKRVGIDEKTINLISKIVIGIAFVAMKDFASAAHTWGLQHIIFNNGINHKKIVVGRDEIVTDCDEREIKEKLKAVCMALYKSVFSTFVAKMNEISGNGTNYTTAYHINILDIFGFETLTQNGFDQLCINYCNEKIQNIFVNDIIVMQQLEYANEGIEIEHIEFDQNVRVIELCEKIVFPLIDEANKIRRSVAWVVESINAKRPPCFSVPIVRASNSVFTIDHFAGSVSYVADDFLDKNSDALRPELYEMMEASNDNLIASLFEELRSGVCTNAISDSTPDNQEYHDYQDYQDWSKTNKTRTSKGSKPIKTMKSHSPNVKACKPNSLWSNSVLKDFQMQTNNLLSSISQGSIQYVRCIRPCDKGRSFDSSYVEAQLISNGIIHACQVLRHGLEVRMNLAEFMSKYPHVCFRKKRSELALLGCKWGKKIVYLSKHAESFANREEAHYKISRLLRRHHLVVNCCKHIQSVARRYLVRELHRKRCIAASKIQERARKQQTLKIDAYKKMSLIVQQKDQISRLEETLRKHNAWMFRAKLLLSCVNTEKVRAFLENTESNFF